MKILIVEDEKDLRNLIELHLSSKGYQVYATDSGHEALSILKSEEIHLCVYDVNMPEMSGYQLLKKTRQEYQVPVLFLTARESDEDKVLGLGLGADDYLTKPISMLELAARIDAHLRRNYNYNKPITDDKDTVELGPLVLNPKGCQVTIHENNIPLNNKEYKLLKLFMDHPGQVFTKKQIYERIWDDYYYDDSNTVMVYISRLRSQLKKFTEDVEIKTIRGLGYKVEYTNDE